MNARACPELRGWNGEQRDSIPAVKNLHPGEGWSGDHLAPGITHKQDHPPQTMKEGAKQEGWGIMAQILRKQAQSQRFL